MSDVGRALALNALKQIPEARFFYVDRPPETRFYSEQTLRGATATQLMEMRKEECLTQDGTSKENSIILVLCHQKDGDMTGHQFEPIPDDGSAARDAAKDERENRMLEAVQLCMSGTYTRQEALLRVGFSWPCCDSRR